MTPSLSDRALYLVLSIFIILGFYQFYFWSQRRTALSTRELHTSLDDYIPFWPTWTWIYSGLYYPAILGLTFLLDSHRQFLTIAFSFIVLLVLQMAFFLTFPVCTPIKWRELNAGRTLSERYLAIIQRFDSRHNSFPSMHTSVAMLVALHLYETFGIGGISFLFPTLIGLSCLFTKQHYVVDILPGALIGCVAFAAFRQLA
ncbi:MAG: phosphatase PAP2 family protein [Ramlibacter sp.]|nr:phosphatase PAP2 family protein [Ramlibacter sp.]